MILGRFAVAILIFVLVIGMMVIAYKAWTDTSAVDMSGVAIACMLSIAMYCTASGLYLLIHFGYLL